MFYIKTLTLPLFLLLTKFYGGVWHWIRCKFNILIKIGGSSNQDPSFFDCSIGAIFIVIFLHAYYILNSRTKLWVSGLIATNTVTKKEHGIVTCVCWIFTRVIKMCTKQMLLSFIWFLSQRPQDIQI